MASLPRIYYSTSPNCGTPTEYGVEGGYSGYRYWQLIRYLAQKYEISESEAEEHIREQEKIILTVYTKFPK